MGGGAEASLVLRHTSSDAIAPRYEVCRELRSRRGRNDCLYLVLERATREPRTCRVIDTTGLSALALEQVRQEVQILCELDHPHIVKLYEYAEDLQLGQLILIMEYVPGGDCGSLIRQTGEGLDEACVAHLARQLLSALAYCHVKGVVHRGICPGSLLLAGELAEGLQDCKIVGFELASRSGGSEQLELLAAAPTRPSPRLPPEEATTSGPSLCGPKSDVWAVGVTVFELLSGRAWAPDVVVEGPECISEAIRGAAWRQRPSAVVQDFLCRLLSTDPLERPSATEALRHPWLKHCGEAEPRAFTADMVQSMAAFIGAPPLARCCSLALAARAPAQEIRRLAAAFLNADGDHSGQISPKGLTDALAQVAESIRPLVSADALLDAADFNHTGGLNFTEFVAACLYSHHGLLEGAARHTFAALDTDGDGMVHLLDALPLCRERDSWRLLQLPMHRPFTLEEWLGCLGAGGQVVKAEPAATPAATPAVVPTAKMLEAPRQGKPSNQGCGAAVASAVARGVGYWEAITSLFACGAPPCGLDAHDEALGLSLSISASPRHSLSGPPGVAVFTPPMPAAASLHCEDYCGDPLYPGRSTGFGACEHRN